MPRAVWNGAISFGLINIPVKLYSAVTQQAVRFNQIDTTNNARVKIRKVNAETGDEVDPDTLARGFEINKGKYVLVSDDELASLQPSTTHTIDLEEFVELGEVDPIYFDGAFHVAPGTGAAKPYVLLAEALDKAGRVAVARFVMRSKQYVALMRPVDGKLLLSMLVYEDELNAADEVPEFDSLADVEVNEREVVMAEQLIESLSAEFDPSKYTDTYRNEVMALITAKAAGETPALEAPSAPKDDVVVDLMAALEKSVAAAKEARVRHPTGKPAGELDDEDVANEDESIAAGAVRSKKNTKKSAKKAAPKKSPAKATAKKAASKSRTPQRKSA